MAASTQNQALATLLFLYRHVLGQNLPWLENVERAKRPARLPLVLTEEEMKAILATPAAELADGQSALRSGVTPEGMPEPQG